MDRLSFEREGGLYTCICQLSTTHRGPILIGWFVSLLYFTLGSVQVALGVLVTASYSPCSSSSFPPTRLKGVFTGAPV